eukprot:CAMPEP_0172539214 /NCGR_PEP_ID=MMETSP1067-20121228/10464_2 /TAXON_ID=265564 ORGANISM="Thalassiosira punctigera, Strain Tpunct2005C2" /NCGR_SAMPLE_ID=MMETSP1067 /ASSEMBLY_ACC=CAM_ASM_000444 /LENGTH=390 /DNA_ID=CAMNT_0013324861 /DNA_START=455 /DNA_END=1627 /DNA_ORIENTATION=-
MTVAPLYAAPARPNRPFSLWRGRRARAPGRDGGAARPPASDPSSLFRNRAPASRSASSSVAAESNASSARRELHPALRLRRVVPVTFATSPAVRSAVRSPVTPGRPTLVRRDAPIFDGGVAIPAPGALDETPPVLDEASDSARRESSATLPEAPLRVRERIEEPVRSPDEDEIVAGGRRRVCRGFELWGRRSDDRGAERTGIPRRAPPVRRPHLADPLQSAPFSRCSSFSRIHRAFRRSSRRAPPSSSASDFSRPDHSSPPGAIVSFPVPPPPSFPAPRAAEDDDVRRRRSAARGADVVVPGEGRRAGREESAAARRPPRPSGETASSFRGRGRRGGSGTATLGGGSARDLCGFLLSFFFRRRADRARAAAAAAADDGRRRRWRRDARGG